MRDQAEQRPDRRQREVDVGGEVRCLIAAVVVTVGMPAIAPTVVTVTVGMPAIAVVPAIVPTVAVVIVVMAAIAPTVAVAAMAVAVAAVVTIVMTLAGDLHVQPRLGGGVLRRRGANETEQTNHGK